MQSFTCRKLLYEVSQVCRKLIFIIVLTKHMAKIAINEYLKYAMSV